MSPAGQRLGDLIGRATRRVRVQAMAAAAVAVAAVMAAMLLVAWLLGDWSLRGAGPLVLLGLSVLAAAGVVAAIVWRWILPVEPGRVAAEAERGRGLPAGSLRGVLELAQGLPTGVSAALFQRSETEVAGRLSGASASDMAGDLGARVRTLLVRTGAVAVALVAVVVAAGFAAPERAAAGWQPLLDPIAHLRGPVMPALTVGPGSVEVARGSRVTVTVGAPLRKRAWLHWRAVGDVPRDRLLPVEAGRAQLQLGPIESQVRYWATAPDGAVSDTFSLRPVDPLMLRSLIVDVRYPPHTGRSNELYQGEVPPLVVPEGTRLEVRGSATRPLTTAALEREDGAARAASVAGSDFRLDWRLDPGSEGQWSWRLRGRGEAGTAAAAALPPVEITVLPDAAPRVRIVSPEPQAELAPSLRQGIVADAEDDYGVTRATLVFRRAGDDGSAEGVRTSIPVDGTVDRVVLRAVLDASRQPLVPGDAIEYWVEAEDNSPAAQVGRSAVQVLRLPAVSELRDQARSDAAEIAAAAERLAEQSRRLEQEARDLSRRAAGEGRQGQPAASAGSPGSAPSQPLDFQAAREAEQVMRQQEALLAAADSLGQRLQALERDLEEAGIQDPELRQRLEELQSLYDQLAPPELRRELEAMRDAVEALDPEAVERALQQLAERQEQLREQVEQSLELMRRAAAEQELNTLAREAEELAAEQRALAQAMGSAPSDSAGAAMGTPVDSTSQRATPWQRSDGRRGGDPQSAEEQAEEQERLRERAEQLNASLGALQPKLRQMGERETASQLGVAMQKSESAQGSMQEAASKSRQQQGSQAASAGQQAASQMGEAAAAVESARRGMSEAWKRQAQQAVQQATQEALSLAQREEALREAMQQAQQQGGAGGEQRQGMQSEQAALQQGLQQLGQNLSQAARQSGLVDPEVGQALARAMMGMEQTMEGLQNGYSMPVQQAGQTVQSLNQLAMSLLQNEQRIQEGGSASALQQAMQQLGELAQQQASLNGQARSIAPMQQGAQPGSQLQQLAQQQRGIGRRVGQLGQMLGGREDVLGGLDPLASEAEALAREMEGGRLDPEVRARQERLFQRLLDAGRSLEREEYSDQRVGSSASPAEGDPPAALDPALFDDRSRFTPPTPEQLRALPPAYRRLILEYFERLNRTPDGAGEGGS